MIREEVLDSVLHFIPIGDFVLEDEYSRIQEYLYRDANKDMEDNISKTFLLLYEEYIVGYYTLKIANVAIGSDSYKYTVPTIEISKFAIDIGYRGQRIASRIFKDNIMNKVIAIRDILPVHMLTLFVDSSNKHAQNVYRKFGFEFAGDEIYDYIQSTEDDECEMMFMKL